MNKKQFFLGLGLTLVFASVVIVPYAINDDYLFANWSIVAPCQLFIGQAINGRILNGVLVTLLFSNIHSLDQYSYIRIISLLGLIWLSFRLYKAFSLIETLQPLAEWLAFAICVMPAFEVYVATTNDVAYTIAAVLAVEAALLGITKPELSTKVRTILRVVASVVLFVVSGLIYQSIAMFYWIPVAAYFIGNQYPVKDFFRRFLYHLAVVCIGGSTILLVLIVSGAVQHARAALARSVLDKLLWFLHQPLQDALNLSLIPSLPKIALFVGVFILVGAWFYLEGGVGRRTFYIATMLALLPLSYIVHLVAAHSFPIYRTEVAFTSLIVLYVFFGALGISKILALKFTFLSRILMRNVLPVGVIIAGGLAAWNVLVNIAVLQLVERQYIQTHLSETDLTKVSAIYILRPRWEDGPSPQRAYDEFGVLSSYWEQDPIPMVTDLLREMGTPDENITIKTYAFGEQAPSSANTLVIDMSKINDFH